MRAQEALGHTLAAVRLDSGDLLGDSRYVRAQLDAAGFTSVRIIASGDLDEWKILDLLQAGAAIDTFGVGTALGAGMGSTERGYEGGALGAAYKAVWYGDAGKDGDKQHTLGQDAWGHKIQVGHAPGGNGPDTRKHFPEDEQPQGRLHGTGQQFGRVMTQLAHLHVGDGKRLLHETDDAGEGSCSSCRCRASQAAERCVAFLQSHDRFLLIPESLRRNARRHHRASPLRHQETPSVRSAFPWPRSCPGA